MFDIGLVQPSVSHNAFAHGAYACNGRMNGLQAMAMQSQESADAVIESFDEYIKAGYSAAVALSQAFTVNKVSEADLTDFDKERINRKVEEVYKKRNMWG